MLLLSAWPWAVQMIASPQGLLSLETFCQLSQCPLESIYIYIFITLNGLKVHLLLLRSIAVCFYGCMELG